MRKSQVINTIMRGTEFFVEGRTIDQEWDATQQALVTYNITWDIRVQQDFENPHRDDWYKEIEAIANILYQRQYGEPLGFKFSGLVGDVIGTSMVNIGRSWNARCTYLLMGGTWSFDTKDTQLTAEQAVKRIRMIYRKAWNALLWCEIHECFSNSADREGYLYCNECDWEKSDKYARQQTKN